MRTPAQQQASRTNGSKSQGPVTPEGKARVSQNGTTHGIYSKRVVVKGEDPQAFSNMLEALVSQWNPVNDFEHNLITDIAEARWRLARFLSLSTEALDLEVQMMRSTLDEDWPGIPTGTRYVLAFNEAISRNRTLEVLEAAIGKQHRIIQGATRQLMQLRKLRPGLSEPGSTDPTPAPPQTAEPEPEAESATHPADTPTTIETTNTKEAISGTPGAGKPQKRQPARLPKHFQNNESKPEPDTDPAAQRGLTPETKPESPASAPEIDPNPLPKAA